jgi:CheY-like chemotaxis protein
MITRILLIDDDSDDRDLFEEALSMVDPHIVYESAYDCGEAIKKLESGKDLPDRIFLDVNMPVINGWQCLDALKKNASLRHIPVIMYSTSSYEDDRIKASALGAFSFWTKPHDFEELTRLLRDFINDSTRGSLVGERKN